MNAQTVVSDRLVVGVLLAAGKGRRFDGEGHKLFAEINGKPILSWSVEAMLASKANGDLDTIAVVVSDQELAEALSQFPVEVVRCDDAHQGQAHSLQSAIQFATDNNATHVVVGLGDQPLVTSTAWSKVAVGEGELRVAKFGDALRPPVRLARITWQDLPATGDFGARKLIESGSYDVEYVHVPGEPIDIDTLEDLTNAQQLATDYVEVERLLGRKPMGRFEVVVRNSDGQPIVVKNAPILFSGRPMPTLYWLCGERENHLIGRLESLKGVRMVEAELGLEEIAKVHDRYRAERDQVLAAAGIPSEHQPSGGVGGTRTGVKCLHAHYGYYLAGGDDIVGQWVADRIELMDGPDWRHAALSGASNESNEL